MCQSRGDSKLRPDDRREYRRTSLRLPISRIGASGQTLGGQFWTGNISAGGMYFRADGPAGAVLAVGAELTFELTVPPGGGYWASAGTVRGTGLVVRAEAVEGGAVGVAVRFSRSVFIDFEGASA